MSFIALFIHPRRKASSIARHARFDSQPRLNECFSVAAIRLRLLRFRMAAQRLRRLFLLKMNLSVARIRSRSPCLKIGAHQLERLSSGNYSYSCNQCTTVSHLQKRMKSVTSSSRREVQTNQTTKVKVHVARGQNKSTPLHSNRKDPASLLQQVM